MSERIATKPQAWRQIARELKPAHLLQADQLMPTVVSSVLIGTMTTILSISFAVLVFAESVPEALSLGIGMALLSNIILHVFTALTSSAEGIISHAQSLSPPIQAAMMAGLVVTLSAENRVTTAVFTLMFSAVFTGAALMLFGRLKIGRIVRFLPFPVISGFLASVGVSLLLGGISTMAGQSVQLRTLPQLFAPDVAVRWLPGVLLAVALTLITTRWRHVLVFPAVLLGAIALFFVTTTLLGVEVAQLLADGWLLGPFASGRLWQPPAYGELLVIDWSLIVGQIGTIATIPIVCLIGALLMLSAIELATGREADPDYELQAMGMGNILSGVLGGGFIGYPSTTFTLMQDGFGARTRLVGMLSAGVSALALLLGANFLGFMPRISVGGLLIYFGYQFISAWVIAVIKQLPHTDLLIIGTIVVTTLVLGFVPAVGVGVLVAAGLFLFNYSRTSVVRYTLSRASHQSRLTRNSADSQWLRDNGEKIALFGLQGYIFFGTASNLLEQITTRVEDETQPALTHVLLDFRHVTGIDTSVVQNFQKLHTQLHTRNITLVFCALSPDFGETMRRGGFALDGTDGFKRFDSADAGLEWCEEQLLTTANRPAYVPRSFAALFAERFQNDALAADLLSYFEQLALERGERLIEQGGAADDLFFIESGRVSAQLERANADPIRLQTMTGDTLVGEIGLYLQQARGATVVVDEPSVVWRLSAEALTRMEQQHPAAAIELHRFIVEKTASRVNHLVRTVSGLLHE